MSVDEGSPCEAYLVFEVCNHVHVKGRDDGEDLAEAVGCVQAARQYPEDVSFPDLRGGRSSGCVTCCHEECRDIVSCVRHGVTICVLHPSRNSLALCTSVLDGSFLFRCLSHFHTADSEQNTGVF